MSEDSSEIVDRLSQIEEKVDALLKLANELSIKADKSLIAAKAALDKLGV